MEDADDDWSAAELVYYHGVLALTCSFGTCVLALTGIYLWEPAKLLANAGALLVGWHASNALIADWRAE